MGQLASSMPNFRRGSTIKTACGAASNCVLRFKQFAFEYWKVVHGSRRQLSGE